MTRATVYNKGSCLPVGALLYEVKDIRAAGHEPMARDCEMGAVSEECEAEPQGKHQCVGQGTAGMNDVLHIGLNAYVPHPA